MARSSLFTALSLVFGGALLVACQSSPPAPDARPGAGGRERAQVDGSQYVTGKGCPSHDAPLNKIRCPGGGCGSVCDADSRLEYDFETIPGDRYKVTFFIDDYLHNCADPISVGLLLEGQRVSSFKGKGTGNWAPAAFEITAREKWTRVGISMDKDLCCQCVNRCNQACKPLYGDMNLYVERVVIEPLSKIAAH